MATLNRVFVKDPDEVKDYVFGWNGTTPGPALSSGDSVSSYIVGVEAGLTLDSSEEYEDDAVRVWLSGGTDGNDYTVTCTVTTAQGRTLEATMLIKVRDSLDT